MEGIDFTRDELITILDALSFFARECEEREEMERVKEADAIGNRILDVLGG